LLNYYPMHYPRSLFLCLFGVLSLAAGRAGADSHSSHSKVDRAVREPWVESVAADSVDGGAAPQGF
jgi:hypothetical protein